MYTLLIFAMKPFPSHALLSLSIIIQPGVLEASERGVYGHHVPVLTRFTPTGISWDATTRIVPGENGQQREIMLPAGHAEVDAVIWCTGYNVRNLSILPARIFLTA